MRGMRAQFNNSRKQLAPRLETRHCIIAARASAALALQSHVT
jgi:hypothetical protein